MTMKQAIERAAEAGGAYVYYSRAKHAWTVLSRDHAAALDYVDLQRLGALYVSFNGLVGKA